MANIKQEDKLRAAFRDRTDQTIDFKDQYRILIALIVLTLLVWVMVTLLSKLILSSNELIFSYLVDHANLYSYAAFACIIIVVAVFRSYLYQISAFKDAFGDGASESIRFFHQTYETDQNSEQIIHTVYTRPTFMRGFRRWLITILTIGAGGSGGLEGPAIPIGEAMATGVSKHLGIQNVSWLRVLQMCGISTAVTTLLHAPLTGCIFASELVFGGRFIYRTLMYSMASSLIAFILSNHIMHVEPLFIIQHHSLKFTLVEYIYVIIVSIVVSVPSGLGLIIIFNRIKSLMSLLPVYTHATIGACMCVMISASLWYFCDIEPQHVLGVGEETIIELLQGVPFSTLSDWTILLTILVSKIILTGFTIVSGGSAGLLIPAVFVGVCASSSLYILLSHAAFYFMTPDLYQLFLLVGIASSLICIVDLPIATIILVTELFGVSFLPPAILAVAVSRVLANYYKKNFIH